MALLSFCGLLTLQVGAAILAVVFFTVAAVVLVANVFDYHSLWGPEGYFPFSLIFLLIFVVGLVVSGILMFTASFAESRSSAITSVVLIAILICYWLILCMFSFLNNPDHVNGICIERRCPESFWIANLCYRRQWWLNDTAGCWGWWPPQNETAKARRRKRDDQQFIMRINNESHDQIGKPEGGVNLLDGAKRQNASVTILENELANEDSGSFKNGEFRYSNIINMLMNGASGLRQLRHTFFKPSHILANGTAGEKKEENCCSTTSRYIFGLPMIGAIVLFFANLAFLIFSALVMYSWTQELSEWDYYEKDATIIVEDY